MNEILGKNIMQLRKDSGLTQEQLATALGISYQAVSKWENGNSCPDISALPLLADLFSVSIDSLFGREAIANVAGEDCIRESEESRTDLGDATHLPWEDDGKFHVVLYHGHELIGAGAEGRGNFVFEYEGPAQDIQSAVSVTVRGDVQGSVSAGESVSCGNVEGTVDAGAEVNCGDMNGDVVAAGNVSCSDVSGSVRARGGVDAGDIGRGVEAGGSVDCGDVGGAVNAGGNVDCGDVGGNVTAGGKVSCADVCGAVISGSVSRSSDLRGASGSHWHGNERQAKDESGEDEVSSESDSDPDLDFDVDDLDFDVDVGIDFDVEDQVKRGLQLGRRISDAVQDAIHRAMSFAKGEEVQDAAEDRDRQG